jgi:hypothetical protein
MYWNVQKSASYAIADLPDAVAAVAAISATAKTGAFISVEADELLTESQIHDALKLANDASLTTTRQGARQLSLTRT